ncbi:DnaJ domain-containing protein [Yoonia maritima]|uniref:DnaJ domain-containing protein n=1 Tax=Yoonia maritima TaxID=1435347 RepID=UPI003735F5F1
MKKDDPFGFDMSVSSSKKKNPRGRRGLSGASETSQRVCEHEGCEEAAKFRAPKSPDILDDYLWFCQQHVREYNLKWNFFETTTEAELAAQMTKDRVWERPTKPMKRSVEERAWARLGIEDPHQVLGANATRNPGKGAKKGRKLPPTERRAVEILEADDNWSKPQIRKVYKSLIKVLHPDMNGGDRSQEEQLSEVVWAWEQIKVSKHFRDKD